MTIRSSLATPHCRPPRAVSVPSGAALAVAVAVASWASPAAAQGAPDPVAQAAPADSVELVDYVVQPGDTCLGIAIRVLGDRAAYDLIHRYNPGMGPTPHNLVPGTVLKLPRPRPRDAGQTTADAHLTDKRGPVAVQQPAAAMWQRALRGMALFRQWRVRSQQRASAEVTFRDGSSIQMRENTLVIIYGPSSRPTLQRVVTTSLESGTLRTRLHELDRSTTLVVETPSAESRVVAGSALLSVDQRGTSRVANHQGAAVRVRSRQNGRPRGRTVQVSEGMGSQVAPGREPSPPRKLPDPPAWVAGERVFAGEAGRGGQIHGAWQPVATAVRYRVEIAADASGAQIVASTEVPAEATRLEAHGLPPGTYHVSVAAIDRDGFEGKPSPREAMTVVAFEVRGLGSGPAPAPADRAGPGDKGEGDDDGDQAMLDVTAPAPARALVQGSAVVAPDGVTCVLDQGSEARATVVLAAAGAHELRCADAQGRALAPVALEVAALELRAVVPGPSSAPGSPGQGAGLPPLPRDRPARVRLELGDQGVDPAALRVLPPPGVTLGAPVIGPRAIELDVTAGPDAADPIVLRVVPRGAEDAVLAEIRLAVAARAEPRLASPSTSTGAPRPAPARRALELGVHGGGAWRSARYELGLDPGDSGNTGSAGMVGSAPFLGLRAGVALHPRLALEGELTATRVTLDVPGQPSADVLGYGVQLRVPFEITPRFRPFLLAGAGVHALRAGAAGVIDDTDPAFYYGAGASIGLGDRLALRLDGRHVLAAASDALAVHLFEISVGVSWQVVPVWP
jgi:opacity protein-like surface antigen